MQFYGGMFLACFWLVIAIHIVSKMKHNYDHMRLIYVKMQKKKNHVHKS